MQHRVGNQTSAFNRRVWLGLLAAMLLVCQSQGQDRNDPDEQVARVTQFRLDATDGSKISLAANKDYRLTVVCFLGTECPLAKLYAPRLAALAKEYSDRSVRFIGVNSNQQDSMLELSQFAAEQKIEFTCVKDYDNVVADLWRVTRTPEVVVVEPLPDRAREPIGPRRSPRQDRVGAEESLICRDVCSEVLLCGELLA